MIYNNIKRLFLLLVLASTLMLSACKDKWEDHNALLNPENGLTLLDKVNQQPELSRFAELLVKTGYDKVLSASKTFTVWAPTNEAIQKVDPSVLASDNAAKLFVANHIVNQNHLTSSLKSGSIAEERIETLSGKYVTFRPQTVDESNIVKADMVVKNGVLHEVDAAVEIRQNIWEYVNALTTVGQKQMNFIRTLNYDLDGTNKVYKPAGLLNDYLQQIARLNNEKGEYTFIVLTDAAFDQEYAKLLKFFNVTKTDARYDSTTVYRTSWNVTKDFAANTIVIPSQLQPTLLSSTGVNVPIDKTAVVSAYRASNGMVYIMNKVDFNVLQDKIRPIIIEGESFNTYSRTDKGANIFTRIRLDEGKVQFTDKFIFNTGVAQFWARVRVNNIHSGKYQVYWRALNDQGWSTAVPPAPINFRQKLGFSSAVGALLPYVDIIPYTAVNYNNPDDKVRARALLAETYLGDITVSTWGFNQLYVVGDNVTTNGLNTISLDYVKLVPIN
jgi:uncharacterized surface protein with fasciclin (FAS1) repeats